MPRTTYLPLLVTVALWAAPLLARADPPARLPVIFTAGAPDGVGQTLAFAVRERLRRTSSLTPTTDEGQAWMWVEFTSVRAEDASTAYALVSGIYDKGAWTGHSYWGAKVGYCGRDVVDQCARTIEAGIDQWVVDFQIRWKKDAAARLQAAQPAAQPANTKK